MTSAKRSAALALLLIAIAGAAASTELASKAIAGQMPQALVVTTALGASAGEVHYQLEIQSGAEGAAFGLQYVLPTWPTTEPVFGSPLEVTSVVLAGAGAIRSTAGPRPKPKLNFGCNRATPNPFPQRLWIEVPANSASSLNLQVKWTYPAWPGTKYGLSFSTFAVDDPGAELTPLGDINVPRLAPKGTRIEMTAQGQAGTLATPEIVGRTFPPFRHARIALRAVKLSPRLGVVGLEHWTDPRPPAVSLGVVRTDGHGHFRVLPRELTAKGPYAVIARSEARGGRASDWNCKTFFGLQ